MAEFKEVMRKKDEMCKFYDNNCRKCPLYNIDCIDLDITFIEEIETMIMTWEKPIDWSKVEVDTKIFVRSSEDDYWKRRYFAKYENGIVYAYDGGNTSWNADFILPWEHAKLWKGEEK